MDKIIFPGFLRSFFTNFRNILFPSCRALNNLLKFWGHALRPLVIILAVPLSIGFVLLDFNYSAVAYPEVFWGIPLVSKITRFSVTGYWFRADLYCFFFFLLFYFFERQNLGADTTSVDRALARKYAWCCFFLPIC